MFWLKIELHSQPKPMILYVIWLQNAVEGGFFSIPI